MSSLLSYTKEVKGVCQSSQGYVIVLTYCLCSASQETQGFTQRPAAEGQCSANVTWLCPFSQQVALNIQSLSVTQSWGCFSQTKNHTCPQWINVQDQSESICHATRPTPTYFTDCEKNRSLEMKWSVWYRNRFSYIRCMWSLTVATLIVTLIRSQWKRLKDFTFQVWIIWAFCWQRLWFLFVFVFCFLYLKLQLNGEQWVISLWRNDVIFLLQPGIVCALLLALNEPVEIRKTSIAASFVLGSFVLRGARSVCPTDGSYEG